jgi:hypothetical protein
MGRTRAARLVHRDVARGFAVATLLALVGGTNLGAQRQESMTLDYGARVPDFTGYWRSLGRGFDQREACGALSDPSGAPMQRCSLPWEAKGGATFGLRDHLNARGLAWMEFRDETMSEKHLCIPNTLPAIQDSGLGAVYRLGPGELHIRAPNDAAAEGVSRIVWLDGRKHPGPHVQLFNGHSIGWYQGDELVIETRNFTFNPDGIEDHIHVPSSAAKIITERWRRVSPTRLDITYTIEDKIFLKKPLVFTWQYQKAEPPDQHQVTFICDPDNAWDELLVTVPSKYPEEDLR